MVPHLETELSRHQQSEAEGGGDGDDCDGKLNHFYMILALKGPHIYFKGRRETISTGHSRVPRTTEPAWRRHGCSAGLESCDWQAGLLQTDKQNSLGAVWCCFLLNQISQ